jgi:hypothetical protein
LKLIGLMPVRNEAWVLGLSARVALMWCDELVIRAHACTDGTLEIIQGLMEEFKGRLRLIYSTAPDWCEMDHRQGMLTCARQCGATHIAIIDADEVLTGNLLPLATGASLLHSGEMLQLPLYNLRTGLDLYHANGTWSNRIASLAFKDNPELGWHGDQFHCREPQGKSLAPVQPLKQGDGGVMHLWGCSERRLLAKHALYKITERLKWPRKSAWEIDRMYSMCINGNFPGEAAQWRYADVPDSWWAPYQHLMKYLDIDAEPWQEAEVRRLVQEHGREKFAGLDLFGVA